VVLVQQSALASCGRSGRRWASSTHEDVWRHFRDHDYGNSSPCYVHSFRKQFLMDSQRVYVTAVASVEREMGIAVLIRATSKQILLGSFNGILCHR